MTDSVEKKVQARTTVRLPEDVHRLAKVAAAQSDDLIQDWVAEAIRLRLAGREVTVDQKWHSLLDKLLADPKKRIEIIKALDYADKINLSQSTHERPAARKAR